MQIQTETKVGIFVILAISVLLFMLLGIGAFRFSNSGYSSYTVSFQDVSGLSRKAEVKIAGVKVGWVEGVDLLGHNHQAHAHIMVRNKYALYDNAYAIVRQEGLIGTKYLEVIPGDPMLPRLQTGDSLAKPGREAVSIDELLFKFKNIARNVEDMTDNLREAFVGPERAEQLKATVENISRAAERIDGVAGSFERIMNNNEDNLDSMLSDFRDFASTLKDGVPDLKNSLKELSETIRQDFSGVAGRLSNTAESISEAAREAREGFQNIGSVAEKIDEGRGLLGKLVNEDEVYKDLKYAVTGIKNYLAKFESMGIVIDSHMETMHRPTDSFKYIDAKGYLNLRVHTADDFFYLAQLVSSEKGFINRKYQYKDYYDQNGNKLDYSLLPDVTASTPLDNPDSTAAINNTNKFEYAPETVVRDREHYAFGLQVGKIYNNLALRAGLFEGAFGVGADYFIPFGNDKIAWTTTLEAFDFRGNQRFDKDEKRPHLKWLNRIFLFNNLYFTFGADDFISKTNANAFWGIGLRFGDDDLKYLLSKFGVYVTT